MRRGVDCYTGQSQNKKCDLVMVFNGWSSSLACVVYVVDQFNYKLWGGG